jgi:polyferredoxin
MPNLQRLRLITRISFFALYLLAPVFNLFRFDLNSHTFFLLGSKWQIGINAFQRSAYECFPGQVNTLDMLINFAELIFIPVAALIAIGAFISWKWGLLYCGWLCPHESMVEIINNLMRRASGKFTLWDRKVLPETQLDGTHITPNKNWWFLTAVVVLLLAFIWAISLLTYLVAPKEIYANLIHLRFTHGQLIFLGIATTVIALEFTFARHLFCRFGCSLGLFQSLMWMLNKKAMVVGFDRSRAKECIGCDKSCEIACPIKLKPRSIKRKMYSCSQCLRCIDSCKSVQINQGKEIPLLQMINNNCALDKSARDFGKKENLPDHCYKKPGNQP